MKPWRAFDLVETALRPGTTLIEASAGTGKTFTIAGLFLRLILERELSAREILVVTFTEAATEELRDRIRQTLASAAAGFRTGRTDDEVLAKLIARHRSEAPEMLARLERALSGFDEAPICTIHSFCQRTLRDRAFESGALFDTELITDDSELAQEIADDYWRKRFYPADGLLVSFALKNQCRPEWFLPMLRLHQRHPTLEIWSAVNGRSLDQLAADLQSAFEKARAVWKSEKNRISRAFQNVTDWATGEYAKAEVVARRLALADRAFAGEPTPESLEALGFFAWSRIEAKTSPRAKSPKHLFFGLCDEIGVRERNFLTGLRVDFRDYARDELPRRKQRLKVQSFDDLLSRLRGALAGPGAPGLIREVRGKYRAALIDEFQDTDPAQYEIFRGLFVQLLPGRGAGSTIISPDEPRGDAPLLFLIGDPKQAIYGFRGADIFTYLEAAASADERYTLEQNWRAESRLVQAVNCAFSFAENPFVFEEIRFRPVRAGGRADQKPLMENNRHSAPLRIWFLARVKGARSIAKKEAEATLPALVAAEIARLLGGEVRLGADPLSARDIAVLVLENRQARLMQASLRERDIPSVLHTEESVFASPEARELGRVLAAIAEPGHERLLKSALATDLLGVSGADLEALTRDDAGWLRHLERVRQYHDRWSQKGFTPMFRQWLQKENVRQRLLKLVDGERRLTNLLHLAEALHQVTQDRRLAARGLVQWLGERIASEDKAGEEHQLRLERDDQAVRLVTVHKSKGLEYPIVFCPFSWKAADLKRDGEDQVLCHRPADGHSGAVSSRFIYDLGSEQYEEHSRLALKERLAESLRLLYVAVTRARNRCYFVWGGFRGAGLSAPAWLFHRPAQRTPGLEQSMPEHFKGLTDAALLRDLQRLVTGSAGPDGQPTIQLSRLEPVDRTATGPGERRHLAGEFGQEPDTPAGMPALPGEGPASPLPSPPSEGGEGGELRARSFNVHISRSWCIASFSTLTAGVREESPDYDKPGRPRAADQSVAAEEPQSPGLSAFPRGTAAGTCLHKILEELDFTQSVEGALERLVKDKLRTHGFPPDQFASGVGEAIRRVLRVPLEPARPDFTLARIGREQRLNELEFYFPARPLSAAVLQRGFAALEPAPEFAARLDQLGFKSTGGFMKGYIDLVFLFGDRFYIVDWKSNWLGNRVEDYHPLALSREMNEHCYGLQYWLYVVALHQYLSLRQPGYDYEKHFGGVFYLFLRGVDPTRPDLGIYRDCPSAQGIRQLSEILVAKSGGTSA